MRLISLQQKKVDEIVSHYNSDEKVKVEFQAPTGSGKTIMATNVISELILQNQNDKFLFIIATLSSSELPKAFEMKIESYKKHLNYSKFDVEHIESPSTSRNDKTESTIRIIPERNKVYIFGKSTFGRNRIFTERNVIDDFVSIAKDQDYKIVYIRDEAHFGLDESSGGPSAAIKNNFENLMSNSASFILEMTATPDFKANSKKVILTEEELTNPSQNDNKWLIKSNAISLLDRDIIDKDLLDDGLKKFKEVQDEYKKLHKDGVYIRPALLIQVDNEPTDEIKKQEFLEEIELIKQKLEHYGLSWVKYFGNNDKESNKIYGSNFTLTEITTTESDIDAIIFKVGPSTGWDIPRACMLLQLRNVSSIKLNTQTIGRIKRNPFPNLLRNVVTDNYYVYSNVEPDKSISIYKYKVKEPFFNDEFAVVQIKNRDELKKKSSNTNIDKEVYAFLNKEKTKIITTIKNHFIYENNQKVFRDIRYTSGNKNIYTEITNVFILLREIKVLINNNVDLYKKIKHSLSEFYKKELQNERLYYNLPDLMEEHHLTYVLLKHFKRPLLDLLTVKMDVKPKYEVYLTPYDPKDYVQIVTGDLKNKERTDFLENYLFDINKNEVQTSIQPLDSDPEEISFSRLRGAVSSVGEKVTIWSKNMTSSNVSADYLDSNLKVKKSYFDYVVKFSNGAFLYIESKSIDDIDEVKTGELLNAYNSYFEDKENTLFDIPIVFSLWKVNKKNNNITHDTYYDKLYFDENLEKLSVQEMIRYIATKKF